MSRKRPLTRQNDFAPRPGVANRGMELDMSVNGYVITGRVVGRGGFPVAGVHVRAYDRDPIWDDRLGNADTDAQGGFRISFTASDFRNLSRDSRRSIWWSTTARFQAGR